MMQPGMYYIGDLCYVMPDAWSEVCDLTIVEGECLNGQFELADGREFAIMRTEHGDGVYFDAEMRDYPVDSGSIGCILASDLDPGALAEVESAGHLVEFTAPFEVTSRHGAIMFGAVVCIDTSDHSNEYDD